MASDLRKQVEELLRLSYNRNLDWCAEVADVFPDIARHYLELLKEVERYKETIAVLEDSDTVKALAAGIEDVKAGRCIDLDKLDLLQTCEEKNATLLEENELLREIARLARIMTAEKVCTCYYCRSIVAAIARADVKEKR